MLKYPLSTEKCMGLIEAENSLVFICDLKDSKDEIRRLVELQFSVKVSKVRTLIDRKGRKKAFVKLKGDSTALDLATTLGLM